MIPKPDSQIKEAATSLINLITSNSTVLSYLDSTGIGKYYLEILHLGVPFELNIHFPKPSLDGNLNELQLDLFKKGARDA